MAGTSPAMTWRGWWSKHLTAHALVFQRAADLVKHLGVLDGGGHGPRIAVGDLLDGAAEDFSGARLGQPLHDDGETERRDRADLVAHQLHAFLFDLAGRAVDAGLQHDEA